jgi:hypothetical protein
LFENPFDRVYVVDFYSNQGMLRASFFSPHYENTFRNANILASHKVGSYNHFHWLPQSGNLRMSPPPSSIGGLNPNRSFGFFFACWTGLLPRSRATLPSRLAGCLKF